MLPLEIQMKIIIFFPPAKNITGGMQVLLQIAGRLKRLNKQVVLHLWDKGHESLLKKKGFDVIIGNNIEAGAADLLLVPEGWPNVLSQGIRAGAGCVVYCQNWAYLFSGLPESISWLDLPVEFISVSEPVRVFIEKSLNRKSPVIRPYIDEDIFYQSGPKSAESINIAYMPRKNRALYKQIRRVFESRNRGRHDVEWICIDGSAPVEVAEKLSQSHIFLATGFPEGCPLPPLEAMACGCLVVGYAGFGGWDYMRQINNGFTPQVALRRVGWQGNGYYSADGDVLDAAINLETALKLWTDRDESLDIILENCLLTAKSYSRESQKKEVMAWIASL